MSFFGLSVKEHLDWITEMDVFYRFVALPHYLLGNIFFVGGLICFLKYIKNDNLILRAQREVLDLRSRTINHNLFFGSFCALMMALIHPVALVIFMGMLGIYLSFSFLIKLVGSFKKLKITNSLKILSPENIFFAVCLLISAPVMLFYKYLMTIPPWDHMAAWEGVTQYHIPLSEFAGAIGPTFWLGIIGIMSFLIKINIQYPTPMSKIQNPITKNKNAGLEIGNWKLEIGVGHWNIGLLFFSWLLSYFALIWFSYPFLHISQVRFTQIFIFIPFGILAAEGIIFLSVRVGSYLRRCNSVFKTRPSLGLIPLVFLILLILLNSLPVYYVSFLSKWYSYDGFSEIAYPYLKIVEGYNWLYKNTNPNDHVLTAFMAGTQIPYMSGNTVFVGHLWATLNRIEKEKLQYRFLENKMSEKEARNFFASNRIKYFFDDYQAASYGIQPQNYSFLKPVYKNELVTIYRANY